jgi:hypothetical protein
MKKTKRFVLLILITVGQFQCGSSNSKSNDTKWSNYSPELKSRIDNITSCEELQLEFNTAYENSDNQRARTGEGNLELMNYIISKLSENNCN